VRSRGEKYVNFIAGEYLVNIRKKGSRDSIFLGRSLFTRFVRSSSYYLGGTRVPSKAAHVCSEEYFRSCQGGEQDQGCRLLGGTL